jgi:hypothetical protein
MWASYEYERKYYEQEVKFKLNRKRECSSTASMVEFEANSNRVGWYRVMCKKVLIDTVPTRAIAVQRYKHMPNITIEKVHDKRHNRGTKRAYVMPAPVIYPETRDGWVTRAVNKLKEYQMPKYLSPAVAQAQAGWTRI